VEAVEQDQVMTRKSDKQGDGIRGKLSRWYTDLNETVDAGDIAKELKSLHNAVP
jgi:hypothetical protein